MPTRCVGVSPSVTTIKGTDERSIAHDLRTGDREDLRISHCWHSVVRRARWPSAATASAPIR